MHLVNYIRFPLHTSCRKHDAFFARRRCEITRIDTMKIRRNRLHALLWEVVRGHCCPYDCVRSSVFVSPSTASATTPDLCYRCHPTSRIDRACRKYIVLTEGARVWWARERHAPSPPWKMLKILENRLCLLAQIHIHIYIAIPIYKWIDKLIFCPPT